MFHKMQMVGYTLMGINKVSRFFWLLLLIFTFYNDLFSDNNVQLNILFETKVEQPVHFIIEINEVNDEELSLLSEKIYNNKYLKILDLKSFPDKGKILLTVDVPDLGNIKPIEDFLLDNGWEQIIFLGESIQVNSLNSRYSNRTFEPEHRIIKRP